MWTSAHCLHTAQIHAAPFMLPISPILLVVFILPFLRNWNGPILTQILWSRRFMIEIENDGESIPRGTKIIYRWLRSIIFMFRSNNRKGYNICENIDNTALFGWQFISQWSKCAICYWKMLYRRAPQCIIYMYRYRLLLCVDYYHSNSIAFVFDQNVTHIDYRRTIIIRVKCYREVLSSSTATKLTQHPKVFWDIYQIVCSPFPIRNGILC